METPSTPPAPPRAKPRRRLWKKIFAAFGLTLLAGVLWLFLSPDEPPPDVSDLIVEPLKLPDEQNAYTLITKAAALVKADLFKANGDKIYDMAKGKNWDATLAGQCLDGTDAIWPLWEQAARASQGQMPWATDPKNFIPETQPFQNVVWLAQIRARELAHDGKSDAAVESLFSSLQVAQRLQQSRGPLILYLTGSAIRNMSMRSLRSLMSDFKPSATFVRQALQQLEASRPDKDSFANALQGELRYFNLSLEWTNAESVFTQDFFWRERVSMRFPLLFKPNQTRRIFAESIRLTLAAIDRKAGIPGPVQTAEFSEIVRNGIHFYSPSNIVGRSMMIGTIPFEESLLRMRLSEQSAISANEAFLALVLWHREHGELPATLDALVPAYLPAVPRDYFDGQPIRYSREFRAVWSVGPKNFQVTSPDPEEHQDSERLCLPLIFAAPPAK